MGPDLLLADIGRPIGGRPPEKPSHAPAEQPRSGFNEYLAEARSARKSAPPAERARTPDQDDSENDERTDDARDASAAEPAKKEEAGGQAPQAVPAAPVEVCAAKPAEPVGETAAVPAVKPAATAPPVWSEVPCASASGEGSAPQSAGQANQADSAAGAASAASLSAAIPRTQVIVAGESQAAAIGADVPEQVGSAPSTTAAENQPAPAPVESPIEPPRGETVVAAAQSNGTAEADASGVNQARRDVPAQDSRAVKPEPVVRKPQPMPREESRPPTGQAQTERPEAKAPVAQRETAHQIRVRESVEARREGSSEEDLASEPSNGAPAGRKADRPEAPAPARPAASRTGKQAGSEPSAFKSVSDSAVTPTGAAKIAEAGVESPAAAERAAAPAASTTDAGGPGTAVSRGATTGAAVNAVTPSGSNTIEAAGTLVGQFLTTELTGSDGPASGARVLNATAGAGRFQLAIQLEPPQLGQLRLNIQMQQQVMTLQVQAESKTAARLIESRMSELREALAVHGIRFDRADVIVKPPESQDAGLYRHPGEDGAGAGRFAAEQEGGWAAGDGHSGEARGQGERGGYAPPETGDGWEQTPGGVWTDREAAEYVAATELSLDLVA
jgi:flagellar hook-length control protein FliK